MTDQGDGGRPRQVRRPRKHALGWRSFGALSFFMRPGASPFARRSARRRIGGGLFAAALLLAACGDSGALDGLPQGREGVVTRVLSGEVIELDGKEQVRLAGITAPVGDAPYALAAQKALEGLVRGRRVILFFSGARQDSQGRTLAQVQDADSRRWIEGALLDAGVARVRTAPDDRASARPMLLREAAARRAERGLWTIPLYGVRLPDEVGPFEEGFMLVEGRVRRVGEGRESLYLDFGDDWRDLVSVVVPRAALRELRTAGSDPFDLEGRLIRVRGVVEGRRLLVDHPEQIERLDG
jgi:micrococcal nuclease